MADLIEFLFNIGSLVRFDVSDNDRLVNFIRHMLRKFEINRHKFRRADICGLQMSWCHSQIIVIIPSLTTRAKIVFKHICLRLTNVSVSLVKRGGLGHYGRGLGKGRLVKYNTIIDEIIIKTSTL